MALHGKHAADVSGVGPSGSIWGNVPFEESRIDPDIGYGVHEDFLAFNGLLTSTTGDYSGQAGGYSAYQDGSNTILQLATEVGGVVRITTDTTDNDESWLQLGGVAGVFGKLATTSAGKKLCFETRFRVDTITSRNIFIGLAEEGFAAGDAITDAGAMVTTKDFIGFRSLEGDANALDNVYQAASQTTVVVKDDAQTLVASTWYKVGFIYDPNYYNTNKSIRFFIDGVELGDGVAYSALDDATFPGGEELSPVFGVKNGTTAAINLDIDWFRIWQAR
jgi:hypothetical protein